MMWIQDIIKQIPGHRAAKVAVLDTGVEMEDSDFGPTRRFEGRVVTAQSANFFNPRAAMAKTTESPITTDTGRLSPASSRG